MMQLLPRGFWISFLSTCIVVLCTPSPTSRAYPAPQKAYFRLVRVIETAELGIANPFGLGFSPDAVSNASQMAFNPENGHLYAMNPAEMVISERSETGGVRSTIDLSSLSLTDPQSILFAPSADTTDAPETMDLYIVDQGNAKTQGKIIELSLTEPQLIEPTAGHYPATLVRIIDCSKWKLPVTDASGIDYWPQRGGLLISDSEIEETPAPYFHGKNLFLSSLSGAELGTYSTIRFSVEPTGIAVNPNNGHIFISDDIYLKIHEVNPGADGLPGTADDTVTHFSTTTFNSHDPEGVAFGEGYLMVVDGVNSEVYIFSPGSNGKFDGIPPEGDDQMVRHFDTSVMGISDPEGIGYNPGTRTLFIAGNSTRLRVVEASLTGVFLDYIDTTSINIRAPAGVAIAPSSTDTSRYSVYVSDRGVDNGTNPNENDGKVYEIRINNSSPVIIKTATPTKTRTLTPTATKTRVPTATPTKKPAPPKDYHLPLILH